MRWLLVAAVAALTPNLARADCALSGLSTSTIQGPELQIAADGGIIVAAQRVNRDTPEKTPGNHPEWRARIGKRTLAPKIVELAPGLYVYQIKGVGEVELVDGKNKPVTKASLDTATGTAVPAPDVDIVAFSSSMTRHAFETVAVALKSDPPAGVFAMVIADAKTGAPLSWGPSKVGRIQNPYDHGDCQMLPNGTVAPKAGDTVTVYWVTVDGRVSPRSRAVRVARS